MFKLYLEKCRYNPLAKNRSKIFAEEESFLHDPKWTESDGKETFRVRAFRPRCSAAEARGENEAIGDQLGFRGPSRPVFYALFVENRSKPVDGEFSMVCRSRTQQDGRCPTRQQNMLY